MAENNSNYSGGIGFTGLLTVAFIVLKLCGVISWSWWWVLSPLWMGAALVLGLVAIVCAVLAVASRKPRHRHTVREW